MRRPFLTSYCIVLVSLALVLLPAVVPAAEKSRAPSHRGKKGEFVNPYVKERPEAGGLLKWILGFGPEEKPPVPATLTSNSPAPVTTADLERIHHPDPKQIQITWIGHATFLIQFQGINALTDPIFSDRATPVSFIGPKRFVKPGIALRDLPPIDMVFISHNHYDHLDAPTIRALGNTPHYFVPLKMAAWFRECGKTNVTEMDWWQSAPFRGWKIHSVPAQHFSGRFPPVDENKVLWTGWVIETGQGNVFFAGDTGYSPQFKEIGEKLGPMRLALIPIGAYRPRWFMQTVHVSPLEAVQIHLDIRSEHSVGMHWGTFKLADEPLDEPPVYLKEITQERALPADAFTTMAVGETRAY